MSKFVVARALKDKRITEVDYRKQENQHEGANINFHNVVINFDSCTAHNVHVDGKIQVGIVTHQKAKSLLEEGVVPPLKVSKFYKGVRSFFETAMEYIITMQF